MTCCQRCYAHTVIRGYCIACGFIEEVLTAYENPTKSKEIG